MTEQEPWQLKTVLTAAWALFLFNMVVAFLVLVVFGRVGRNETVIVAAVGSLAMLTAVWWIAIRGRPDWVESLGLRLPRRRWPIATLVTTVIVAQVIVYVLLAVYSELIKVLGLKEPAGTDVLKLFGRGGGGFFVAVIVVGVLAPITEELFFRSLLYKALRGDRSARSAAVISALIFAFFHLSFPEFVPLAIIGVTLALVYERTGSLFVPITLHALNNLIAVVVFYVRLYFQMGWL